MSVLKSVWRWFVDGLSVDDETYEDRRDRAIW